MAQIRDAYHRNPLQVIQCAGFHTCVQASHRPALAAGFEFLMTVEHHVYGARTKCLGALRLSFHDMTPQTQEPLRWSGFVNSLDARSYLTSARIKR